MFSTSTQFDAASALSGGGFMTTQANQLNDSSPAPAKSREIQGLGPVTVKQISEASHSGDEKTNFAINGVHLTNDCDFDEIPFHFINCIHDHLCSRVDGPTPAHPPSPDSSLNTCQKCIKWISSSNTIIKSFICSTDGLKDCNKLVLDYLEQQSDTSDERGIHVDELTRKLKLPSDKIMSSLAFLFVVLVIGCG